MIKTSGGYRVYFPGDELPQFEHVMGADGRVARVEFPGMRVQELGARPGAEVVIGFDLPDFEKVRSEALIRQARQMQNAPDPS